MTARRRIIEIAAGAAGIAVAGAILSGVLLKGQPAVVPTETAESVNA